MKRTIGVMATLGALMLLAACTATPPQTPTGPADTQAPQLSAVDVSPLEVAAGQPLSITATVSDNVGVTGVAFVVRRNGLPAGFCSGNAVLDSGTAQIGTWRLQCTTPTVLNAGTYQVNTAVVDAKLNSVATVDGPPTSVSGHFTVLGDTADSEAPQVVSVTSTPSTVARGGTLTISAHITDSTGVKNVAFAVRLNKTMTQQWCLAGGQLVSGTATDGVWELTCQVGVAAQIANYRVNTVATDLLNNIGGVGDAGLDEVAGPFNVVAAPAG